MRITPNVRSTALVAVALVAVAMMMHPVTAWAADAGPATTVVDNPYGLEALWAQGDWVAKGTLAILFIMSLGTWYLGIVKLLEQSRLMREAKMARTEFWGAATIAEGALKLDEDSAFRYLADEGIKAAGHHEGSMTDSIDLSTWIGMSLQRAFDEISDRMQGGLAFLGTVGSTAPFVGLFGTVWGIYGALTAIGMSGQASIDKVAGPVGESLIMTALGLAVAVPAVLGYNWMVRRNKTAMAHVKHFSSELHMVLLAGGKTSVRSK
ncbi:MAG: MotA/TolQ/ExbB proton channel family protein [Rhodocyclaceae bacterium]|nr:MotA/TolQ/ExbB proton channel family protein [Rhodocyclaceae bacterium]MBL0076024.1 MotA/TolQ/ExbB proton channel family protein [Rhodocyclaceae bacterium]MBP6108397.1 MotA/TolQ/ExbB proton channel family protein [Rhodocyclaceae bacterium]MBP6279238.1 MotA/TolQ/ExbB proton channel family protein [Rhodocyclaceae bacterium]